MWNLRWKRYFFNPKTIRFKVIITNNFHLIMEHFELYIKRADLVVIVCMKCSIKKGQRIWRPNQTVFTYRIKFCLGY